MPVDFDHDSTLAEYAHPERLVSTVWLATHLGAAGTSRAQLGAIYLGEQESSPDDDVIAGSWTEWRNAVRGPIVVGEQRGEAPAR